MQYKNLGNMDAKGQRTKPSGGFHAWHYEADNGISYDRILVWTLYLNDDFDAGETGFSNSFELGKDRAVCYVACRVPSYP